MRPKSITMLIVAALLAPSAALAALRDFIPRPVDNGGYLDIFAAWQRDENRSGIGTREWSDNFIREKITLFSNGYVYHPRFLQYQISLAGALKQEEYRNSSMEPRGWNSASGLEYDAKLFILPEHRYNLELYSFRFEPLFKEQSATQHNSVESSRGASFRYRRKPFFFHSRYGEDSVESDVSTTRVRRIDVGGEYLRRYRGGNQYSLSLSYKPSIFTSSLGLEGSSRDGLLSSAIDLQRMKLTASMTAASSEQKSRASGRYGNDQIAFYEYLSVYLPQNFRTDISYRIQDNRNTSRDANSSSESERSDTGREFEFDVLHKLYQSLDTRYALMRNVRDSQNGEIGSLSHSLSLNYTKAIPRGRISAGISLGRGGMDSKGRADIINEPHDATPVPGSFNLVQGNAARDSIKVYLKSPVAPFATALLIEDDHYFVTVQLNIFVINVFTLPTQYLIPGRTNYDLFVTYSLAGGDFELRTDTAGYNASVQLLEDMLTPYISYSSVRSKDVGGTFPGIPLDTKTFTSGLMFHRGPVRARGEYQSVEWEVSPYRSWRGEFQAVKDFRSSGRLFATLAYTTRHFPRGTSVQPDDPYSETMESAAGGIQKEASAGRVGLSAGGSYSRMRSLVDSNSYSLNASLTYKIGRVDLTVGASAYRSVTDAFDLPSMRRTDQYYYVKLRRELF